MPSPFELGRAIGSNISGAFSEAKDNNAIESILRRASRSNDPNIFNDSIAEIITRVKPERAQNAINALQARQEAMNYQNQLNSIHPGLGGGRFNGSGAAGNPVIPANLQVNESVDISERGNVPSSTMPNANAPQKPVTLQDLTDDQLIQLSGVKGWSEQSKQELKRRQSDRDLQHKRDEAKIKSHTDLSQKVLEQADKIAENIPQKRSSLNLMKEAIANKDFSFFSKDKLADITGIDSLRSEDAAVFKAAGKEYLLGNIARAGARPNQWIEQQIQEMLPKIGNTPEANLSIARALENELDLDQERVRVTERLASELEQKLGYVPRDLGKRVNDEITQYAERKQNELFNDLRAIKAIADKKGQKFMKVHPGTAISRYVAQALLKQNGNDPKKAEEEAKRLGYSF